MPRLILMMAVIALIIYLINQYQNNSKKRPLNDEKGPKPRDDRFDPFNKYYAVIFTTKTTDNLEGYEATNHSLEEILKDFEGYIGMDSSRDSTGNGITVSYWRDEHSIRRWKENESHKVAREQGKKLWYEHYHLRVCQVLREYDWKADGNASAES